jgi:hypothetical protein
MAGGREGRERTTGADDGTDSRLPTTSLGTEDGNLRGSERPVWNYESHKMLTGGTFAHPYQYAEGSLSGTPLSV